MIKLAYGLNEFHEFIKKRKCYCFGAGLQGLHIIYMFENWKCTENIISFIDNNHNKRGKSYNVENFSFPIISIEDALKEWVPDSVIIITCADIAGVMKQLHVYEKLEKTVCFSLTEVAQRQLIISDYDKVIKSSAGMLIPKKIHYCWFGNQMPDYLKKNISGLERSLSRL